MFRYASYGVNSTPLALRRFSMIFCVGCPVSSSSQWRRGYSYGEFRIGRSKKGFDIISPRLAGRPRCPCGQNAVTAELPQWPAFGAYNIAGGLLGFANDTYRDRASFLKMRASLVAFTFL